MTYPLEFRQRVMAHKAKKGLTFEQTSELFDVNIRTLFRWHHKIEPCTSRNKLPSKIPNDALIQDVQTYPDDTLQERAQRFGVTASGIGVALKRLNISRKKTLHHPKADSALRLAFEQKIRQYQNQGKTIIYLDESGFAKDMPRTHGYAFRGKRCYGVCDWHARGRCNVIGAIIGFCFLTVSLFEGNINSDIFFAWLEQDLLPKVQAQSVLVMDNARFHKRQDMLDLIASKGLILEFLPPYSPDLNPIEKKWAQAKAIRRKLRCNDIGQLFKDHMEYDRI